MTDERVTFFIQKAGWSNYEISQHFKKLKNLVELVESYTLTKQKAKWYQEGVEAEREACAKLLEAGAGLPDLSAHSKFEMYLKIYMQRVADQIRARGE